MKKNLIPLVLFASTTLLTACNNETATTNTTTKIVVAKEDAIAVVNGTYISKATLASLENELAQRQKGQSFPKEKLVEELIQRELLLQEAVQKKLDQTVEYTTQLETIKTGLLTQAAVQNFLKSNPVTDADLQAEYDKNVAASGTEYKARHILLKSEEDAKKVIAELASGADFAELAKTKSTGPSGPQGGDLGWFAAGQMVAPFSEAVIALEDNKVTQTAVKTQFGYHVILREGSRAQTPPPFESVKERIRPMIQRQKLQSFMEGLRKQATVEVFTAPAAEVAPAGTTSDVVTKSQSAVEAATKNAKAAVTETAGQVDKVVSEQVTKTLDVIKETAEKSQSAVTDAANSAKSAVTKAAEKADQAVSEKATSALDALTK